MNVIDALQWRYATKKFDSNKLVSENKINTITEAFNLTATSYGLQPIKLVIIQNKKLQQELVAHSMNQLQVAQASHVLVFCIETGINKPYIDAYFNSIKAIRNTPEATLAPFKNFLIEDFKNKTKNDIALWATKQAYLAMGNLLTVCGIERIDACPMEGFSSTNYNTVLKLEQKGLSSVLVMPIGYRHEEDYMAKLKKVRKGISKTVIRF